MTELKIKGRIESVEQKSGESASGQIWKRAAFKIDNKTYSTFDEEIIKSYQSGDYVELEYTKSADGKYSNIAEIKKIEQPKGLESFKTANNVETGPVDQSVWDQKDRRIVRQSCLKAAIESINTLVLIDIEKAKTLIGENQLLDTIIEVASTFEGYVYSPMPEVN